jgi:nitrate/TMAO reductase-like tetraheme cytochrome c subunit
MQGLGLERRLIEPYRIGLCLASVLSALLLAAPDAIAAAPSTGGNSCEDCHSNPDFLVTNKKLYAYYAEWSNSVHRQEGVECDDCHGGDATSSDEAASHGDGVGAADPRSGVYYKNIVETCGTCHEDVLEGFRKSTHFKRVQKKKGKEQGPTCVTCHGSINSEVLNVNNVGAACARCHNEKTDNHPEHPEKAKAILNRFLSINRFYRYITVRAQPDEARAFFEKIDPQIKHLAVTWHSFDLKAIDAETRQVLETLSAKRDEIRARPKLEPAPEAE